MKGWVGDGAPRLYCSSTIIGEPPLNVVFEWLNDLPAAAAAAAPPMTAPLTLTLTLTLM